MIVAKIIIGQCCEAEIVLIWLCKRSWKKRLWRSRMFV